MIKILLVEDDKSLREIYGVRLLAEGYDIVSAGDGEAALAMAIKERPSLIVSDVMMPKISGFDMLDILRSTTETKDIKVIMMTALSSEDQRQRGEKLGADRYLVKSQVGIEDVVRTVHEVLGDMPGITNSLVTQPQNQSQQPTTVSPPQRPDINALSPQRPTTNPLPEPGFSSIINQPPEGHSGLPRPTAPFSSESPRPANLGSRSLQPLENNGPTSLGDMMTRELNGDTAVQQPQITTQPSQQQPAQATPATQQQPAQVPQAIPQPTAQPSSMPTHPSQSGLPSQQPQTLPTDPQQPISTPQGMNINPISGHQAPSADRR